MEDGTFNSAAVFSNPGWQVCESVEVQMRMDIREWISEGIEGSLPFDIDIDIPEINTLCFQHVSLSIYKHIIKHICFTGGHNYPAIYGYMH